jgi:hypothetical protein
VALNSFNFVQRAVRDVGGSSQFLLSIYKVVRYLTTLPP